MSQEQNGEFVTPDGTKGTGSYRPENMGEEMKEIQAREHALAKKLAGHIPINTERKALEEFHPEAPAIIQFPRVEKSGGIGTKKPPQGSPRSAA